MSFNFGGGSTATAAKPAFGFGSTAATTVSSAPASSVGFSFGSAPPANAAKPVATISSGFSFGAAPTTSAAPLSFGAATTQSSFGGFGTATALPSSSLTGLGGFGAPAPAAASTTGFGGFGAATAAPVASSSIGFAGLGQPPSTVGTSSFSLSAAPKTTPAFGAGFGVQSSTATAKPAVGFGALGASTTTSASGFPSIGGFGAQASTAAPAAAGVLPFGAGLGGTVVPTSAPTLGLGGTSLNVGSAPFGLAASSLTAQGASQVQGTGGKSGKDDSWKDSNVPPELTQDVDSFRKFVKENKGVSTDMSHLSLPKLHQKIQSDVGGLNVVVKELWCGVAKQRAQLERLKRECAKELMNVETAQRTKDTPAALQYENNNGPMEYFHRLLANFEAQMVTYKRQIEEVENHLQTMSLADSSSPETLIKAMQQTQAAFVSLAGRYQPLHEAVQQQKSVYVQHFRQKHGTAEHPFGKSVPSKASNKSSSTVGPSPFSGRPDPLSLARAAQQMMAGQANAQVPSLGTPLGLGLGANTSNLCFGGSASTLGFATGSAFNSTSLFGNASKPGGFGAFGQPGGTSTGTSAFAAGRGFNASATSTPGLLGSTMSPFGAAVQPGQQPFAFQTGGKRAKH